MIATSNRAPDDLYKNGLQRDRFLPFIELLKQRLEILELGGDHDYRMDRLRELDVYLTPLGAWADAEARRGLPRADAAAPTASRACCAPRAATSTVPRAAPGVAMAHYLDWCARPMGAADFLCIADHFHTVILADIPKMGPDSQDKAARFVTMIDSFYERKVKFICSAAAAPEQALCRRRRRLRVPAHGVAPDGDAESGISRAASTSPNCDCGAVARRQPRLRAAVNRHREAGSWTAIAISGRRQRVAPHGPVRRPRRSAATFALAVQPVQAQTMITTPADGLTAGAVKVKTKDGKEMDGLSRHAGDRARASAPSWSCRRSSASTSTSRTSAAASPRSATSPSRPSSTSARATSRSSPTFRR